MTEEARAASRELAAGRGRLSAALAAVALAAAGLVTLVPAEVVAAGAAVAAARCVGWALVAVAAFAQVRGSDGRQAQAHALLVAAAAAGVTAAAVAATGGALDGRALGREGVAALAFGLAHGAVVVAFVRIEVSQRRWRRSLRVAIDALVFGLVGLAWVAPALAGVVRPGLPAAALAVAVVAATASVAAPLLASFDAGRGGRWRWLLAALVLATAAAVQLGSLAVVVGSHAARRLESVASLVALGALAVLVARGLMARPPVRPGIRAAPAWWRGEWVALALAASALVGLAAQSIVHPDAHPALADRLRATALVAGALLMIARAGVVRADVVASLRTVDGAESDAATTDRMAALAELSRIVAHEVRNSLSVLFSATSLLKRDPDAEQRDEILASLDEEGDRMSSLVDELSAFARGGVETVEDIALYELVRDATDRARAHLAWPQGTEIDVRSPTAALIVRGDWQRLEAALAGVLVACARSGAGRVRLRVGRRSEASGGMADVFVEGDRGEGVAAMLDGRAPGGGRGARPGGGALGLAVARRAVEDLGGSVRLDESRNGALRAHLALPLVSAPDESGGKRARRADGERGGDT